MTVSEQRHYSRKRWGARNGLRAGLKDRAPKAPICAGINNLMTDFFDDPVFVKDLFEWVVEMELSFAKAQVDAGVDMIGVGDAAASLVGPAVYEEFVWPYEKKLVDGLHRMGVPIRLHICGNTRRILDGMGRLGCEMIDLDLASLAEGRQKMGPKQILCGNVHPVHVLRDGNPESIKAAIQECHRQAGANYILGAGCEVPRGTPDANLLALAEYAHSH